MEESTSGDSRLIRTVRFRARHHYRRPAWTEAENRRVFGEQSLAHEHAWSVEVHVAGSVDPATGWCADLGALDAALAEVLGGWEGGDLNALVPEVARGEMMPSTEELARWIHGRLQRLVAPPARLVMVRVNESEELGSQWPA